MDYGKLSRDLVADAIMNKIPGLNAQAVFHVLTAQGDYDAVTGTYAETVADSSSIPVVVARPTMHEVADDAVVATDVKIIVPGKLIAGFEIDETNTTCTIAGKLYKVIKTKGVPGGSIFLVFARRT